MVKILLNTLFIANPDAHARLDHDTLKVESNGETLLRVPLLHLSTIVLFGNATISYPAMMRCAEDGRSVVLLDYAGRFKARVVGPVCGNVLLRQAQYDAHRDLAATLEIARTIVAGKIRNMHAVIVRGARESKDAEGVEALRDCAQGIARALGQLPEQANTDAVRGVEGQATMLYFAALQHLIRVSPSEFSFSTRSRRPPRDRMNALMSFLYSLLTTDCVTACEGVGLDPQFGYLHVVRPGKPALALDLMEEFRPCLADRLALSLVNRRQVRSEHFEERDNAGEATLLNADGRKIVLTAYQDRKKETVPHPFLKDNAPFGLIPHLQARLLARKLRGNVEHYLPFAA